MVIMRKKNGRFLGALFLTFLIITVPGAAAAGTTSSEFAMFKRTITPVWQWGENGILTVPKATTIGKYNMYAAMSAQEAGQIQGEKLYNSNASIVIGTSEDAELGYTKRQLIWEDGDRTDLEADVFHLKARILNLSDSLVPQVSIGVIGTSLKENQFSQTKDILFNPFAAATINIPLFSEKHRLSLTAVAESLFTSGESTETFLNAGADIGFFDNTLILAVEYQGIGRENTDAIVNAGAKLKFFDMLNIGVGSFNMIQDETDKSLSKDNSYMMGFVSLELPLGRWSESKEGE